MLDFHFINAPTCRDRAFKISKSRGDGWLGWRTLPSRVVGECSGSSFAGNYVNPDNPKDTSEVLLYDEPTAGLDPIASTVLRI